MVNFGYPYNDIVICKDSTDYLVMRYGLFESKQYCAYLATTKNHVCDRYLRVKYRTKIDQ